METEKLLLDYCRVKKIFEKGFGFLTSLYYPENVFFHFSKIHDDEAREKLEQLKRGDVYVFYTSHKRGNRRKVSKIWLDLCKVNPKLLPPFITRLVAELHDGRINIFELAHVIKLLDELEKLTLKNMSTILGSKRVKKTPTSVKHFFSDKNLQKISENNKDSEDLFTQLLSNSDFKEKILKEMYSD